MSIKRTPHIDLDQDFTAEVPITKSYVDAKTGQRHIVGVASGVNEDRDGERMSRNAISKMAAKAKQGGVKLTSGHLQDWMTEIGDVVKASHDPATDELEIDAILPPEGVDPIADKAWRTVNTQKVGFSVGGKLLKAFHERTDTGKRRKVLDAIDLRHVALTKNPSYAASFANAVAKSFTGDTPADEAFTVDYDEDAEVAKDLTTGSWVNGSSDSGGGNQGRDSVGSGQRNAGQNKGGAPMKTEDPQDTSEDDSDSDADDGKDKLPQGKNQDRHLACPNCGHEFAADLPTSPDERQIDDLNDDDTDEAEDDDSDTSKSTTERTPPVGILTESLDALKALAATEAVQKTDDTAAADTEVAKNVTAEGELSDVEKLVAASHRAAEDRFETLEKTTGEAFEIIAKSLKGIQSQLADLPAGRKSTARVMGPSVGHESGMVEKTAKERAEEAPDAITALKILNEANGITK